jgi:hypothetical protein
MAESEFGSDPFPQHGRGGRSIIDIRFGFENLRGYAESIDLRISDYRPWFRGVVVPGLATTHRYHFNTQGRHGGADWSEPYSPRYEKWKLAAVGHLKKNILKRKLVRSLVVPGGPHQTIQMTTNQIAWGTEVEDDRTGFGYAIVMQGGGKTRLGMTSSRTRKDGKPKRKKRPSEMGGKSRIPARPPMIIKSPPEIQWGLGTSALYYIVLGSMLTLEEAEHVA